MFPCRAQPRAPCRGHQVHDTDGLGISPCFFRAVFVPVRSPDCGHPKNQAGEVVEILVPGLPSNLATPPPPGESYAHHAPVQSHFPHTLHLQPLLDFAYVLSLLAFPNSSSSFRLLEAFCVAPSQLEKGDTPLGCVCPTRGAPYYLDLVVEELG